MQRNRISTRSCWQDGWGVLVRSSSASHKPTPLSPMSLVIAEVLIIEEVLQRGFKDSLWEKTCKERKDTFETKLHRKNGSG